MDQIPNCEQIFILELLIENLKILDQKTEDSLLYNFSIKFGCLSCFDISIEDAISRDVEEDGEIFKWNSGKSCLFSIRPDQLANIISSTPLQLVLYQKKSDLPKHAIVGTLQIPLGEEFLKIAEDAISWVSENPASAMVQDRFDITSSDGDIVAMVDLSLRLTSQGTCILTNIQISDDHKFRFEKDIRPADPKCKACSEGKIIKTSEKCNEESICVPDDEDKNDISHSHVTKSSSSNSPLKIREEPKIQEKIKPKIKPKVKIYNNIEKRVERKVTIKRKKEKRQFYPGPVIHRGVTLGHVHCQNSSRAVPAKHGWAWTTTTPAGIKQSDVAGWKPGYFHKSYLKNASKVLVDKKNLKNLSKKGVNQKIKKVENRSISLRKKSKLFEMEYAAPFSEKVEKRKFPANSADSDFEINVQLPEPLPEPPKLRHQAQQFCEEDFPKPKLKAVKLDTVQKNKKQEVKKQITLKKINKSSGRKNDFGGKGNINEKKKEKIKKPEISKKNPIKKKK